MVQLIADETGAVRKDVESMLGDVETAVKGAEGSVIKLDEKTESSITEIKKSVEIVSGKNEEMKEELKKEIGDKIEEVKEEVGKSTTAAATEKPMSKEREEEIKKIAKGAIEDDIKQVIDKVKSIPQTIDWDALKTKAGVPQAAAAAPAGGGEE